jgi:hypothetical protein
MYLFLPAFGFSSSQKVIPSVDAICQQLEVIWRTCEDHTLLRRDVLNVFASLVYICFFINWLNIIMVGNRVGFPKS